MKVIGVTGGVGAGKSALLAYISKKYDARVILADEVAHRVEEPGQPAYEKLTALLSPDILREDGFIDKGRMAAKIFGSQALLEQVNGIIHPAVREVILAEIAQARQQGKPEFLFIEAALLIECGYGGLVDELWYIYAKEEVRCSRLQRGRHYTEEKIKAIMGSQLPEEEFRKSCHVVIDNSGSLEDAFLQIDEKLGEYL